MTPHSNASNSKKVQPHLCTQKTLEKPEMTDAGLVPHRRPPTTIPQKENRVPSHQPRNNPHVRPDKNI